MDILVVDDEPIFRAGLRGVLEDAGFRVVGEAGTARAALALLDKEPDLVIMDLVLPGMDGIAATREVRRRLKRGKVVVLTSRRDVRDALEAMAAGASGYLVKSESPATLAEAVRRVAAGETYVSDELAQTVGQAAKEPSEAPTDVLALLSKREREIFHLLVSGLGNQQIARELCISMKTLGTHRHRIYDKLGCHSIAALIRFAVLNHLLRDAPKSVPS
jgi:DNA-binding NarL/FixJ family response regulator